MSSDQQKIFDGKRTFHRKLAERPIAEKLRMLDALRERELAIRGRTSASALREIPTPYHIATK